VGGTSRMTRECHARICARLEVKSLGSTRRNDRGACGDVGRVKPRSAPRSYPTKGRGSASTTGNLIGLAAGNGCGRRNSVFREDEHLPSLASIKAGAKRKANMERFEGLTTGRLM
jgi:hypothetical protein